MRNPTKPTRAEKSESHAGPAASGSNPLPSVRWADLTWEELEQARDLDPVVMFAVGSLEQHGPHLPVSVDTVNVYEGALRTATALAAKGVPALVLPPLWFGYSPHHMAFPGTVTLRSETFLQVVEDVVDSVVSHGFRRIVIINGHGGNVGHVGVASQRLGERHRTKAHVVALTYWHLLLGREEEFRTSPKGGVGHACEFETSLQMVLAPELVRRDRRRNAYVPLTAGEYQTTDLFKGSAVTMYEDFRALSPSGVFGEPGAATPEKGQKIVDALVEELGRFVEAMRTWPL